jgi:hypothetical protein
MHVKISYEKTPLNCVFIIDVNWIYFLLDVVVKFFFYDYHGILRPNTLVLLMMANYITHTILLR